MRVLTGTGAHFTRAIEAMRSCACRYMGPDHAPNGLDVVEAVDKVLDRMRPACSQTSDCMVAVELDEEELFAAGSVLGSDHWLRRDIARRGLPIAPPCRRAVHFARI